MNTPTPEDLYLALVLVAFAYLGFTWSQARPLDRVRWLTGCWEARNPQRTIYEQWTPAEGGVMLATARTIRDDSLTGYEFVALREKGERLAYEAHPSGQAGATFLSIALTDSSVTFENLENDFPTRVGYNRRGADSVVAWISGQGVSATRRIEFPYSRVRCEPTR